MMIFLLRNGSFSYVTSQCGGGVTCHFLKFVAPLKRVFFSFLKRVMLPECVFASLEDPGLLMGSYLPSNGDEKVTLH